MREGDETVLDEREWQREEQRLHEVLAELRRQRDELVRSLESRGRALVEDRREMWEDAPHAVIDFDEAVEMAQHVVQLADRERDYRLYGEMIRRLERMMRSPYFARIDFLFQGEASPEAIYIGIASLTAQGDGERLIYDWRAPISSMYYDYGLGRAEFMGPAGPVRGELLNKRQYKIRDGRIEYMFDSDVGIGDEILQQMLSKNVDEKMSSIVASIQREQNRAIRDDAHAVLVVEGPAGSGKTSIALQRIAYLLYKYRRSLTSQNVILFAPNRILHDYVSDVLPELGEENVQQMTFHEYAVRRIGAGLAVEDMNRQLEFLLAGQPVPAQWGTPAPAGGRPPSEAAAVPAAPPGDTPGDAFAAPGGTCDTHGTTCLTRVNAIRLKFSSAYLTALEDWVARAGKAGMPFADVVYQGVVMVEARQLRELFYGPWSHLALHHRLAKAREWVRERLDKLQDKKREQYERKLLRSRAYEGTEAEIRRRSEEVVGKHFRRIRLEARRMFATIAHRLYEHLFESPESLAQAAAAVGLGTEEIVQVCKMTLATLRNGQLLYEDVAPLLYVSTLLHGAANNAIMHVLVDEAQDYTRIQFETLRRMFPRARFTFLGDPRQSIHPYLRADWLADVAGVFGDVPHATLHLRKSYRSTEEIVQFTRMILPQQREIHPVRRSGDKPCIVRAESAAALVAAIQRDIGALQSAGFGTIAVLAKTDAACAGLFTALSPAVPRLRRLTWDDTAFHTGVVVVPSYLAKGLEFDAVLIADASAYQQDNERHLLYTVCTRALHRLRLYERADAPSPLLAQVAPELYDAEQAGAAETG